MNSNNQDFIKDYGPMPIVFDIKRITDENKNFRTAFWTGKHLQVTLMNLNPGEDIGLERHIDVDQMLVICNGAGVARMGRSRDRLEFERRIQENSAVIVPAGTWHNIINTGNQPLKLFSIYAPVKHKWGTIHRTKRDAEMEEK